MPLRLCLIRLAAAIALCQADAARATAPCILTPDRDMAVLSGALSAGERFRAPAGPYAFVLEATQHGWWIALQDASGRPIPVQAPPLRPVETNPVNIAGWHFRNAANTGPNTGDVNAPQHARHFSFGAAGSEPFGRGTVILEEFTLSPPGEGAKARIETMTFRACLVWDTGQVADPPAAATISGSAKAVATILRDCGFDSALYRLSQRMDGGPFGGQQSWLVPDFDGDGQPDLAVAIERRADVAPGVAICLRGSQTLLLAGYQGRIGRHLDPAYFNSADFWDVYDQGPVGQGVAEGPPPRLRGDAILLGKSDASSALLLLGAAGGLTSYWQGD